MSKRRRENIRARKKRESELRAKKQRANERSKMKNKFTKFFKSVFNYIRTDYTQANINLAKLTAPRLDGHPNCVECGQNRFKTVYSADCNKKGAPKTIECRNPKCRCQRIVFTEVS